MLVSNVRPTPTLPSPRWMKRSDVGKESEEEFHLRVTELCMPVRQQQCLKCRGRQLHDSAKAPIFPFGHIPPYLTCAPVCLSTG